jgi:hypothetical protein
MWEFLRELNAAGTTIILTTHYLEEAENLCRNVAIIDHGRMIEYDRMSSVLRKLQEQVRADAARPAAVPTRLPGFTTRLANDHELEVVIAAGQDLNELFAALSAPGCRSSDAQQGQPARGAVHPPDRQRPRGRHCLRREPDGLESPVVGLYTLTRKEYNRIDAHLDPDDPAAGDHHDAVLPDLRQPDRPAHRPDGRLRLHAVHRPGPDHDGGDHQLLRQRRVVVLLRPSSAATSRRCWSRRCRTTSSSSATWPAA